MQQYFFSHYHIVIQQIIRAAQYLDIFFYYRESMTENLIDLSQKAVNEETLLSSLNIAFPQISTLDVDKSFLNAPGLKKLTNLIKYSIPVHTYPSDLLALYELISDTYYSYIFRNQLGRRESQFSQTNVSFPQNDTEVQNIQTLPQPIENTKQRVRINYMQFSRFIHSYNAQKEVYVHQEVIRQGQMFQTWQHKEVDVLGIGKQSIKKPYKDRNEKQQVKAVKQKSKINLIDIKIGKSISKETSQMKNMLIKRALNNRMMLENTILSQLEIVENQITYILNRITEEYFEEFMEELKPYASNQIYSIILAEKIILKVMEEHNFIKIYSHLVKALKNIRIFSDKNEKFKEIFSNKLQISFYQLIRRRQWQNRQQLYKKQLIGVSMFLGQLIHSKILSKYIFPDLFFQLISSYIHQYQQHIQDKNFFYHQIYVQCIIKIIQKMGKRYDDLLKKKTSNNIDSICVFLLLNYENEQMNYEEIVDYIMVLRAINEKLPSQRFKIAFLLEDFRCNKVIKKREEEDENNQYEIVKSILAIDHQNAEQLKNIPKMISKCNLKAIMKDYYFQFAEGSIKQVNRNIETFKYLMQNQKIIDSAVSSLKDNIEGLSLIQTDFPFLAEGIARILKQICDHNHWQWKELDLNDPDEDVMYFIEKIESKYFKMIVQD